MNPLTASDERRSWVDAHVELDRYLTALHPAALVIPQQRSDLSVQNLTDEQIQHVGALYGRVVGCWARYVQALRLENATLPATVVNRNDHPSATAASEA